jgi:hypothetical protein
LKYFFMKSWNIMFNMKPVNLYVQYDPWI